MGVDIREISGVMFVNKGNQIAMLDNINRDMRYEKFHSAFPNKEGDATEKAK